MCLSAYNLCEKHIIYYVKEISGHLTGTPRGSKRLKNTEKVLFKIKKVQIHKR